VGPAVGDDVPQAIDTVAVMLARKSRKTCLAGTEKGRWIQPFRLIS